MADEYGGIEVDEPQTDQFGGIAVSEEAPKATRKGTFLPEISKEGDARIMGMGEPLITLPRVEGSNPLLQAFMSGVTGQPPSRPTADTAAAAINVAKTLPEFITSPLGIATAPVAAAGGIPARLLGLGFAGQMASQVPESAREAGRLSVEGTPQEAKEALLGLASNIVLPAALAGGALGRPSDVPRGIPRTEPPPDTGVGAQPVKIGPLTPETKPSPAPPSVAAESSPTAITPSPSTEAQVPLRMWSSGEGETPYLSNLKSDVEAYAQGRSVKEYEVQPKNPFDPSTSKNVDLVSKFDELGGIQEAPRNKAFVRLLKDAGYDSIVGGEKGYGGESNWVVPLDKSILKEITPSQGAQVPITPSDLEPALIVDGKPVVGGEDHGAIRNKALAEADTTEQVDAILKADKDDSKHVFVRVDKEGKPIPGQEPLTRVTAADALGEKEPLQSSRLRELQKAKPEPEPVGMGAAVAPEFENNPSTPTGIRNAIVDKERVKRGLPEAMQAARRSFGDVWDKAMALLDREPAAQDVLIDEIRDKPRALTDQEDALLLHRQIDLQNEYGKATRDLAQAYDDGRLDDMEREKIRVAGLADKLFDIYNIGKTAGTETARGLSARRMMANEDFTLTNMLNEKRAAQGGLPLSEEQRQQVEVLHQRISDLEKQLDALRKRNEEKRGGGQRPTRPPVLDPEEQRANAANERAKQEWKEALARERLRIRSPLEKTQDALVKWRRAFVLSSPITLAKLTSAAVERMAFTPLEEAIGAGIGRVIPGVAEKAAREGGGINARAEAKALTEGFTKGMRDSWDVLRTGKSSLDVLYGKAAGYPVGVSDFFGHVHGALKTVTKRNEFARSFEKRAAHAIAQGVDVSDPGVQSNLAIEAYKDANRSIFQQDNRVVTAYKAAIRVLETKAKDTGRTPLGSKAVATTGKLLLPVVRIPTNIVAETLQTATGIATGSARLGRALYKGVENLSPDEADIIMRSLKKGSIGAAVLALGYLNADVIGGYYQPGAKKPGQQGFGTVKLYGHEIPSYLLHNPLLETLQIGATARKIAEAKFKKKDKEAKGLGWGTVGAGMGVLEEVPFMRESMELAKTMNPAEQRSFFGELFKSLTVPQGVQWWAAYKDTDQYGNPIQRKPTTLVEHEKTGIPGLREQVPEKAKPKKVQ